MISVRFEGMLVFFKSSQFWPVLKFRFHSLWCLYGCLVEFFGSKSTHKNVVKGLRAIKSERILLGRYLVSDLFQWGLQTADLRESLFWIMKARGSGVTQAYFFDLSKMGSYPGAGI